MDQRLLADTIWAALQGRPLAIQRDVILKELAIPGHFSIPFKGWVNISIGTGLYSYVIFKQFRKILNCTGTGFV
jgi:hypothetical protein